MKYNSLIISKRNSRNRVGRGISAGQGKTAGRGTKGQNSRTGAHKKPGFEGGQNPLMQRLPKLRGFKSHKSKPETVFTSQIQSLQSTTVTNESLAGAGITSSQYVNVKLIANGEINRKVSIKLQSASNSAVKAIEKVGGNFESVPQLQRQKVKKANSG